MTQTLKNSVLVVITTAVLFAAFALAYIAKANPSFFIRSSNVSTTFPVATTTRAFLSAGLGTTTLPMDLGVTGAQAADNAVLALQITGSTTAASLTTIIEYAQGGNGLDCVVNQNSCDWYYGLATTTPSTGYRQGGAASLASTTLFTLTVPTPTRYVRAVITAPAGGVASAVWAEFIAKRQAN